MRTITTDEAKVDLSHYLAAVESGEEIIIVRDKKPVAERKLAEENLAEHDQR